MSRNKAHHRTASALTSTWRRARQAKARLQPAADHMMPLARNARSAAKRQADKTRSWAAPHVEQAGQVVQDSIAPKISSLMSRAARRLEPAEPRRPRWPKLLGASAVTAAASAAAAAAAAAVRSHMKAGATDQAEAGATPPPTETAPEKVMGHAERSASSDISRNSEVRTS